MVKLNDTVMVKLNDTVMVKLNGTLEYMVVLLKIE